MKDGVLYRFLIRWLVCSLGLWLSAVLLGSHLTYNESVRVIIFAGLILAFINSIIKPIVVLLSLPALLLTLGLFMIVINGLMILLVAWLYEPLQVSSFWVAILAGMIIGLVNYVITTIFMGGEKHEHI